MHWHRTEVNFVWPFSGVAEETCDVQNYVAAVGKGSQYYIALIETHRSSLHYETKCLHLNVRQVVPRSCASDTEMSTFPSKYTLHAVPRCFAAQRSASCWPFCTSTANQMIRVEAKQIENSNGNPCQVLPVLSMIARITFGPTIEDARFVSPNWPKNMKSNPGGESSAITVCENA